MAPTLELFVFHLRNKSFGFGKIIKVNNNFWVNCPFKRSTGSGKTRITAPIDSLICNSHGLLADIILSLFIIRSVFPDISCYWHHPWILYNSTVISCTHKHTHQCFIRHHSLNANSLLSPYWAFNCQPLMYGKCVGTQIVNIFFFWAIFQMPGKRNRINYMSQTWSSIANLRTIA